MDPRERWLDEQQAVWLYGRLAHIERDPAKAALFRALAGATEKQAALLADELARRGEEPPTFRPTARSRLVAALAARLGVRRARPLLAAAKVRGLSVYTEGKVAAGHPMPTRAEDIGQRHRRGGASGSLRAAVFGVNDGLVSNASLIMGVAGAGPEPRVILLAGLAGLLAGAFSMAAGEYVSMRSQRELFEHQIAEERDELERYPDEEAEELAIIYEARGVPLEEARRFARSMLGDREEMLNTLAREELGLNPDELGSPLAAALSSFVAFALGASLPLLPFLLSGVGRPVPLAAGLAAVGLFLVGAALSLFSGRSALAGGARMLALGAGAAAATWGIGSLVGGTVA